MRAVVALVLLAGCGHVEPVDLRGSPPGYYGCESLGEAAGRARLHTYAAEWCARWPGECEGASRVVSHLSVSCVADLRDPYSRQRVGGYTITQRAVHVSTTNQFGTRLKYWPQALQHEATHAILLRLYGKWDGPGHTPGAVGPWTKERQAFLDEFTRSTKAAL